MTQVSRTGVYGHSFHYYLHRCPFDKWGVTPRCTSYEELGDGMVHRVRRYWYAPLEMFFAQRSISWCILAAQMFKECKFLPLILDSIATGWEQWSSIDSGGGGGGAVPPMQPPLK